MAEDVAEKDLPQQLSSRLTDVGSYSYSALCAVSLVQLFEEKWHKNFKEKTLKLILKHLVTSSQVNDSILFMIQDEATCCDDPKPFADVLLEEPCIKDNGLPVVTDLITLAISDGIYDARMRVLIKYIAWQLRVSWDHVEDVESMMAETLEARQYKMSEEEIHEKKKKERNTKIKRFALIGLATVGGGALIGLTGGLAAPLVAAGTASIIGGAGAAALGSTAGVAVIGSLFGVAGAGLTGFKMNKRVGAIEEFAFEPLLMMGKQLHITIAVTGWLTKDIPDFKMPWQSLAESREQYSIRWESKYLLQMGNAMDYLMNGALSMATQEALKYTILAGIITAVVWPSALLAASSVIDNPWSVCVQRANASGKELAEVLLARQQGNRPVTLVGFSLGAKVIFSCLEELSKRKGGEGIVEDVVLLGAPVTGNPKNWENLARIIAGKIINGYCRGDWLLKFLYRTASVQFKIAGLGPIKWDNRRMHNIDLSDVVTGHKDYMKQLPTILKVVGIRTKEDVVIGQVPPHKLFPTEDSGDSFTSSEGEEEEGDENKSVIPQDTGTHGNSMRSHGDENKESKSSQSTSREETKHKDTGKDFIGESLKLKTEDECDLFTSSDEEVAEVGNQPIKKQETRSQGNSSHVKIDEKEEKTEVECNTSQKARGEETVDENLDKDGAQDKSQLKGDTNGSSASDLPNGEDFVVLEETAKSETDSHENCESMNATQNSGN